MLRRLLGDEFDSDVRDNVTLITASRLACSTAFRFAPPFLAIIARGLHASLSEIGAALAITEFGGLLNPLAGRLLERWSRRNAMVAGLAAVSAACIGAAMTPNLLGFAIAVAILIPANNLFVISVNSWLAERVPYERLSRVVGVVELSWAGALLTGVPILGLVSAVSSWRGGYVGASLFSLAMAVILFRRLPHDTAHHLARRSAAAAAAPQDRSWVVAALPYLLGSLLLMSAAQTAFVTFGSWLKDDFGFSTTQLSAFAFAMGIGELTASSAVVRFTDRIGKRRAMILGTALIVPAGALLALGLSNHLGTGLPLLIVYILGFEFAIVSSLPLATSLVPGRPSTGVGLSFGAGTVARAAASVVASRLYDQHGFRAAAALGACCAAGSCLVMSWDRRRVGAAAD